MADVVCLRLMQAFRRVSRGMRRWQDGSAPPSTAPLSPRHIAALEQLLGSPLTVGELASRLGLTWNFIGIASMHSTIIIHAVFTRAA